MVLRLIASVELMRVRLRGRREEIAGHAFALWDAFGDPGICLQPPRQRPLPDPELEPRQAVVMVYLTILRRGIGAAMRASRGLTADRKPVGKLDQLSLRLTRQGGR